MVHTKYPEVTNMKKGIFSKLVVFGVIIANVVFTVVVLKIFLRIGAEPTTLIMSWFGFTTAELWSLASIKKAKENNRNGGNIDG